MTKEKLFSFGNISGVFDERRKNDFKVYYENDYYKQFLSKETFEHREEGLNFDYKYLISIRFLENYEIEEEIDDFEKCFVNIYLIPTSDSMCEKIKESLGEWFYYDAVRIGHVVRMLSSGPILSDKADKKACEAMNAVVPIDGMRGFYLDRPWNEIGTTGWDKIKELIGKIDNCITDSIERMIQNADVPEKDLKGGSDTKTGI
ncbi:MAG: hypothetical protein ACOCT9_01380 [archaeon]